MKSIETTELSMVSLVHKRIDKNKEKKLRTLKKLDKIGGDKKTQERNANTRHTVNSESE